MTTKDKKRDEWGAGEVEKGQRRHASLKDEFYGINFGIHVTEQEK